MLYEVITKLLAKGPGALSDAELLAIFLRTGVAGCDAVTLARQLLAQFGGLRALLAADEQQFCQAHGLGTAKFVQLQAVLEMSRRHLAETLQRRITSYNVCYTKLLRWCPTCWWGSSCSSGAGNRACGAPAST